MKSEFEKLLDKIGELREQIEGEVGASTMDLINELVELELEAESFCNQ